MIISISDTELDAQLAGYEREGKTLVLTKDEREDLRQCILDQLSDFVYETVKSFVMEELDDDEIVE